MPLKLKNTTTVLKKAFTNWLSRDPFKESSVIAYTAIFSLPGLLVVVVTLSAYFFGPDLVTSHIHQNIASVMGIETADQIREMILFSMRSNTRVDYHAGWCYRCICSTAKNPQYHLGGGSKTQ